MAPKKAAAAPEGAEEEGAAPAKDGEVKATKGKTAKAKATKSPRPSAAAAENDGDAKSEVAPSPRASVADDAEVASDAGAAVEGEAAVQSPKAKKKTKAKAKSKNPPPSAEPSDDAEQQQQEEAGASQAEAPAAPKKKAKAAAPAKRASAERTSVTVAAEEAGGGTKVSKASKKLKTKTKRNSALLSVAAVGAKQPGDDASDAGSEAGGDAADGGGDADPPMAVAPKAKKKAKAAATTKGKAGAKAAAAVAAAEAGPSDGAGDVEAGAASGEREVAPLTILPSGGDVDVDLADVSNGGGGKSKSPKAAKVAKKGGKKAPASPRGSTSPKDDEGAEASLPQEGVEEPDADGDAPKSPHHHQSGDSSLGTIGSLLRGGSVLSSVTEESRHSMASSKSRSSRISSKGSVMPKAVVTITPSVKLDGRWQLPGDADEVEEIRDLKIHSQDGSVSTMVFIGVDRFYVERDGLRNEGTVTDNEIHWDDGDVWVKAPEEEAADAMTAANSTASGDPTLDRLTGTWKVDGDERKSCRIQDGEVVQEDGTAIPISVDGEDSISIVPPDAGGGQVRGTIVSNDEIEWDNGEVWSRAQGTQHSVPAIVISTPVSNSPVVSAPAVPSGGWTAAGAEREKLEAAQDEVERLRSERHGLADIIDGLKQEAERLKLQAEQAELECEGEKHRRQQLQAKLTNNQIQVQGLHSRLTAAETKRKKAETDAEEAMNRVERVRAQLTTEKGRSKQYLDDFEDFKKLSDKLRTQLAAEKTIRDGFDALCQDLRLELVSTREAAIEGAQRLKELIEDNIAETIGYKWCQVMFSLLRYRKDVRPRLAILRWSRIMMLIHISHNVPDQEEHALPDQEMRWHMIENRVAHEDANLLLKELMDVPTEDVGPGAAATDDACANLPAGAVSEVAAAPVAIAADVAGEAVARVAPAAARSSTVAAAAAALHGAIANSGGDVERFASEDSDGKAVPASVALKWCHLSLLNLRYRKDVRPKVTVLAWSRFVLKIRVREVLDQIFDDEVPAPPLPIGDKDQVAEPLDQADAVGWIILRWVRMSFALAMQADVEMSMLKSATLKTLQLSPHSSEMRVLETSMSMMSAEESGTTRKWARVVTRFLARRRRQKMLAVRSARLRWGRLALRQLRLHDSEALLNALRTVVHSRAVGDFGLRRKGDARLTALKARRQWVALAERAWVRTSNVDLNLSSQAKASWVGIVTALMEHSSTWRLKDIAEVLHTSQKRSARSDAAVKAEAAADERARIAELQTEMEAARRALADAEAAAASNAEAFAVERASAEKRMAQLQDEFAEAGASAAASVEARLAGESPSLEEQLRTLRESFAELESKSASDEQASAKERAANEERVAQLQTELVEAGGSATAASEMRATGKDAALERELRSLQASFADLEAKAACDKQERAAQEERVVQLQKELAEAVATAMAASQTHTAGEDVTLESQVRSLQESFAELEARAASDEQASARERAAQEERVAHLQQELAESQARSMQVSFAELEAKAASDKQERTAFEERVVQLQNEFAEVAATAAATSGARAAGERPSLECQLKGLQESLSEAHAQIAYHEQARSVLEEDLVRQRASLAEREARQRSDAEAEVIATAEPDLALLAELAEMRSQLEKAVGAQTAAEIAAEARQKGLQAEVLRLRDTVKDTAGQGNAQAEARGAPLHVGAQEAAEEAVEARAAPAQAGGQHVGDPIEDTALQAKTQAEDRAAPLRVGAHKAADEAVEAREAAIPGGVQKVRSSIEEAPLRARRQAEDEQAPLAPQWAEPVLRLVDPLQLNMAEASSRAEAARAELGASLAIARRSARLSGQLQERAAAVDAAEVAPSGADKIAAAAAAAAAECRELAADLKTKAEAAELPEACHGPEGIAGHERSATCRDAEGDETRLLRAELREEQRCAAQERSAREELQRTLTAAIAGPAVAKIQDSAADGDGGGDDGVVIDLLQVDDLKLARAAKEAAGRHRAIAADLQAQLAALLGGAEEHAKCHARQQDAIAALRSRLAVERAAASSALERAAEAWQRAATLGERSVEATVFRRSPGLHADIVGSAEASAVVAKSVEACGAQVDLLAAQLSKQQRLAGELVAGIAAAAATVDSMKQHDLQTSRQAAPGAAVPQDDTQALREELSRQLREAEEQHQAAQVARAASAASAAALEDAARSAFAKEVEHRREVEKLQQELFSQRNACAHQESQAAAPSDVTETSSLGSRGIPTDLEMQARELRRSIAAKRLSAASGADPSASQPIDPVGASEAAAPWRTPHEYAGRAGAEADAGGAARVDEMRRVLASERDATEAEALRSELAELRGALQRHEEAAEKTSRSNAGHRASAPADSSPTATPYASESADLGGSGGVATGRTPRSARRWADGHARRAATAPAAPGHDATGHDMIGHDARTEEVRQAAAEQVRQVRAEVAQTMQQMIHHLEQLPASIMSAKEDELRRSSIAYAAELKLAREAEASALEESATLRRELEGLRRQLGSSGRHGCQMAEDEARGPEPEPERYPPRFHVATTSYPEPEPEGLTPRTLPALDLDDEDGFVGLDGGAPSPLPVSVWQWARLAAVAGRASDAQAKRAAALGAGASAATARRWARLCALAERAAMVPGRAAALREAASLLSARCATLSGTVAMAEHRAALHAKHALSFQQLMIQESQRRLARCSKLGARQALQATLEQRGNGLMERNRKLLGDGGKKMMAQPSVLPQKTHGRGHGDTPAAAPTSLGYSARPGDFVQESPGRYRIRSESPAGVNSAAFAPPRRVRSLLSGEG